MGKLKWVGTDFGNWRIEGRTVIHRSWSGVVWRKKGSASSYEAGCRFGKKPLPPPAAIFWHVTVDGYEPSPFQVVLVFGVAAISEATGFIGSQVVTRSYEGVELPMLTLTVLSVSVSRTTFEKTYDIRFGPVHDPLIQEQFTLSAPPFNNLELPTPNLDSQLHIAS